MSSSSSKRGKRSKRSEETLSDPGAWECTVCTYQNAVEAFKCEMCDTRKGTSTRKPKLNSTMVEQHTIVQNFVVQQEQQQLQSSLPPTGAPPVVGRPPKKHSTSKNNVSGSPSGTTTPTPSRSTRSVESPSDHSLSSSADQSPSTSKNPTPQPSTPPPQLPAAPPSPVTPVSVSLPATPVSSTGKVRAPKRLKSNDGTPKQPALRNVDRRSGRSLAITVNGTTVVITDYKLKPRKIHTLKKSKSEPSGDSVVAAPESRTINGLLTASQSVGGTEPEHQSVLTNGSAISQQPNQSLLESGNAGQQGEETKDLADSQPPTSS